MGIRAKLIAGLLLLFVVLGLATMIITRQSVIESYTNIEIQQSEDDVGRLLQSLDVQLGNLSQVVREWSNWAELHAWAIKRDEKFEQENLQASNIASSDIAWLAVLDREGRPIVSAAHGLSSDQTAALGSLLQDPGHASGRVLRRQTGTEVSLCGLIGLSGEIMLVCRLPILNGAGQGPVHGAVVAGRFLRGDIRTRVQSQVGLRFNLIQPDQTPPPESEVVQRRYNSLLGPGPLTRETMPELMRLRYPVLDLAGQRLADLVVEWPRSIMIQGHQTLNRMLSQLLTLGTLVVLCMLWLIDRIVVLRLEKLRGDLDQIRATRDWDSRLDSSGGDEIGQLKNRVNDLLTVISDQVRVLEVSSETDALTGLANRRKFDARLAQALSRFRRHGRPFSLVLADIDFFKAYNDSYGHQAGDETLRAAARCLAGAAGRPGDLACRVGGEEFAVILEDTDLAGAQAWAEGVRNSVLALGINHAANPASDVVSLSAGVATIAADESGDSLYARADQLLYRAKAGGRNRVVAQDG